MAFDHCGFFFFFFLEIKGRNFIDEKAEILLICRPAGYVEKTQSHGHYITDLHKGNYAKKRNTLRPLP